MPSLQDIRENITDLDQSMLEILSKRRLLSIEVARSKLKNPKAVRDQQREQELLLRLIAQGRELGLDAHYVTQLYHTIIEDSVLSQQAYLQGLSNPQDPEVSLKVAFLGTKGSYSNIATHRYFSRYQKQIVEIGCSGFQETVDTVEAGLAEYALLPIENTSSGSINEVYDVLQQTTLSIVGEITINIDHAVLVKAGTQLSELHTLYAHPQPYQQCSRYLRTLSGIKVEFVDSSSTAMQKVRNSKDAGVGALGSQTGGEMYQLDSLANGIANQQQNQTRFIIVGRKPVEVAEQVPARTTFILSTAQKAGSLVEALQVLREHNINMSKLESRPVQGNPWEEMFYVDVSANVNSAPMQSALAALSRLTRYIKVLGCYPSENVDPTQVPFDALVQVQENEHSLIHEPSESYSLSSRQHKPENSVVRVGQVEFGKGHFVSIAGPAAVESKEQLEACARHIKESGAAILHSSCFHNSHSPYGFQGMGNEGLSLLKHFGQKYHLPTATEVQFLEQVQNLGSQVDILHVRGEQMQNFNLLKELGLSTRPVILERSQMASIEEWLYAADYILAQGNQQVILCESGIRTFEGQGKATLDLGAVALLKERTHLPVIINPIEAIDDLTQLPALCKAAKAIGADGVLLLSHPRPTEAKIQPSKSLDFDAFSQLLSGLYK
ncbi:chorismate mutase [Alginatibacterium sediminis]|uniref:chorismate mutase n=1 Tax=Alginatibacterium sediminis TaxID=2164068 RepID=A0A420ED81_9ALTE|nr:chorismate mutase [Alginatibacterium sediminis]RKF18628.1 chorismate mutase [Alginatibacterium sediminis]